MASRPWPSSLSEVGDFEAEDVVVRVLLLEGALDFEGGGILAVVAEEEGEDGARFDGGDGAVFGGLAEVGEAFLLVAADAHDADHEAEPFGKAGDGEALDADGHPGVGVLGIDFEGGFGVVARGVALAGGGGEGVVDEGDEDGVHAFGVAAGEEGVGVVGIGVELGVGEVLDLAGEVFDACAGGGRDGDFALHGEEAVVRVVGGVEEILVVELAKDEGGEEVVGRHGVVGILAGDLLLDFEGGVEVEVVEELEGLADGGREVEGVGVEDGLGGGGGGRSVARRRRMGRRACGGPGFRGQSGVPPRQAVGVPTEIDYTLDGENPDA